MGVTGGQGRASSLPIQPLAYGLFDLYVKALKVLSHSQVTLISESQRLGCPGLMWVGPPEWPRPQHQPPSARPQLTMMQLGLLMDHRLTRQSSPPVASSRPEALPSTSEDTLLAWATISSARKRGEQQSAAWQGHGLGTRSSDSTYAQ